MTLLSTMFAIAVLLLLVIGLYSLIVTRNLIRVLLSVEILVKAVSLLMIGAGHITGKMGTAQSFVITIIVIEVMLLVVATGIVFGVYKKNGTLDLNKLTNLKG